MSKKIDLTGKQFGKLTVLKESEERTKAGSVCWVCQCECGNIITVSGANLRTNNTKSCGCQKKESAQARVVDLTGQRFGMITVKQKGINPHKNKSRHTYWVCDCDCGRKDILIDGEQLKNGHTKSCGCINYSIGEQNIELLLKENNISYIKEFKFNDLGLYRFDFYLPEYNRLIEFDGIQHFQERRGSWNKRDSLKQRQERDKIKNQYALDNNIDLIRIPYWERDNITIDYILKDDFLIKEEN